MAIKAPPRRRKKNGIPLATPEEYAFCLDELARERGSLGAHEEARDLLLRANALSPCDPRLRCNLYVVLSELGDHKEAGHQAQLAAGLILIGWTRLEGAHAGLLAVVGFGLFEHELGLARKLVRKAVSLDKDNGLARHNYASLLVCEGRHAAALPHWRAAVRLRPDDPDAIQGLGSCYIQLERFDDARRVLADCVARFPDIARARFNLGLACLDSGHPDEAAAAFESVVHEQPDAADAHGLLGVAYALQGSEREARAAQRRARELAGDEPPIQRLIAEIDEFLAATPN